MNKFNKLYNKIITEMNENISKKNINKEDCIIKYYAAYSDDGKLLNKDENLMDLEMNCTMIKNHVNKFKIYKVEELYHPTKYTLIETYIYNSETGRWGVIPNDEKNNN